MLSVCSFLNLLLPSIVREEDKVEQGYVHPCDVHEAPIHRCCFSVFFYLITNQDCVALSSVHSWLSSPPEDEVVVCLPDSNDNARDQAAIFIGHRSYLILVVMSLMVRINIVHRHFQDIVTQQILQVDRSRLLSLIRLSATSPSTSCNRPIIQRVFVCGTKLIFVHPSARQDDFRTTPSTATTTSTSTLATSTSRGYHPDVVLADCYSSQSISALTRCFNCRRIVAHRLLLSACSSVSPSAVLLLWLWGDVRVYFVGSILYIIDCHMYPEVYLVG
jgi:hypothetical protein